MLASVRGTRRKLKPIPETSVETSLQSEGSGTRGKPGMDTSVLRKWPCISLQGFKEMDRIKAQVVAIKKKVPMTESQQEGQEEITA